MGFKIEIDGPKKIELGIQSITKVTLKTDTPKDSNARSKDVGSTMIIAGKILTALDGEEFDSTRQLGLWSLVPAEKADSYRKATVNVISADKVIREIVFPNAFVVDYKEHFGDTEGVGEFELVIKQKKDKLDKVTIKGGF